MKKILITGASGFIGSFLVEEALHRGWEVWAGIRKSSSREYLKNGKIQFIDLNFSDEKALVQQLEDHVSIHGKWDYIVHNAGVTKCMDFSDFEKINYLYTCHFVESLVSSDCVPEQFILMSSLSAFPDPQTAYGKSKLKAEQFLQQQSNFPFIILRPTGVYGPREKDYFMMMKSIQSGFDFSAGFKPQILTFIYVMDLVKAVLLALESDFHHRIYAVADGKVYSNETFSLIVRQALGKKFVVRIKLPLFILKGIAVFSEMVSKFTQQPATLNRDKYKIMKQRDWTCDTSALANDLGFTPDYDLSRGVEASIEWYRTNRWL